MSAYATQRYQYAQWIGSNAEEVADLLDVATSRSRTSATADLDGTLRITYDGNMDRLIAPDNYLVVSLGYYNQEVTPAVFAEWFVGE